jgi:hypothetical protein
MFSISVLVSRVAYYSILKTEANIFLAKLGETAPWYIPQCQNSKRSPKLRIGYSPCAFGFKMLEDIIV